MRIWRRYRETIQANWHLGMTCFGGPAVQFQTVRYRLDASEEEVTDHGQFHKIFVEDKQWIDEPMYQQIFCLSQTLPGSASVKMLLCINAIRNGLRAGFLSFLMFSLPGAIGMYALGLGIGKVTNTLPAPAYALLSGLNAATVGVIALAGVKLAQRAVTDKITRLLVFLGGVMGMLYTALWYYPVIMLGAGATTYIWDMGFLHHLYGCLRRSSTSVLEKVKSQLRHQRRASRNASSQKNTNRLPRQLRLPDEIINKPLPRPPSIHYKFKSQTHSPCYSSYGVSQSTDLEKQTKKEKDKEKDRSSNGTGITDTSLTPSTSLSARLPVTQKEANGEGEANTDYIPAISWQLGSLILLIFGLTFILFTTLHIVLKNLEREFELFSSLYLAGTIIFGGGPVVIPLLREYIVSPGWVSPRDFLLGIAVIQAFPGPNFNFVVYLGALAVSGVSTSNSTSSSASAAASPSYVGAIIAFIAMYTPGLFIVVGFMGLWRIVGQKRWFLATLRGVNAAAVGLVFTAVWKLWEMGRLTPEKYGGADSGAGQGQDNGASLGGDPWLVLITASAYVGGAWFGVSPPVAILLGGALGVGRWGVVDGGR